MLSFFFTRSVKMMAKITEKCYCNGTRGVAPRHVISGSISKWFDKFFNAGKSDRKKKNRHSILREVYFKCRWGYFVGRTIQ